MDQSMLSYFSAQGPWALLFVVLFYFTLKAGTKREEKLMAHNEGYQKVLQDLSAGQTMLVSKVDGLREEMNRQQRSGA